MKIRSNRLNTELEVEVYQKDDVLIIRHTSLENIFWRMPDEDRPEMRVDTVDLARIPGIPPMFAVKCELKDPISGCVFEQLGEMLCANWQIASKITRDFPLTMCKNQAFDRAFVRYLQLDIQGKAFALYTDSEIEIPHGMPACDSIPDAEQMPMNQAYAAEPETNATPTGNEQNLIPDTIGLNFEEEPGPAANEQSPNEPVTEKTMPDVPVAEEAPQKDIWANMSVEETMEAYGFDQHFPYMNGNGKMPEVSSPFPWGQNPATVTEPIVDMQIPEYPMEDLNQQVPYEAAKNTLAVYEAGFDFGIGKTVVKTNAGTAYYDPFTSMWETNEFDMAMVDLNDLYQKTSALLGKDLRSYNGPSLP